MVKSKNDHEWHAEGLDIPDSARSGHSASRLLGKLTGPLRRISGAGGASSGSSSKKGRHSSGSEGLSGSQRPNGPATASASNPFAGGPALPQCYN